MIDFQKFAKPLFWGFALVILYLSFAPSEPKPPEHHLDKLLHLGAYAVLTLFSLAAYPHFSATKIIILIFAYGLAIEIIQPVFDRLFEIFDLVANFGGILLSAWFWRNFEKSEKIMPKKIMKK